MDKLSSALDCDSNRENLNDIGHWPLCPGYWVTLKLAFWKLSPSINSQQRLYSRIFLQTYPSKYDVWIHAVSPSILFNGTFDVLLSTISDRSFLCFLLLTFLHLTRERYGYWTIKIILWDSWKSKLCQNHKYLI